VYQRLIGRFPSCNTTPIRGQNALGEDRLPSLAWFTTIADRDDAAALLTGHGLPPDRETVERVARALFKAKVLAAQLLE